MLRLHVQIAMPNKVKTPKETVELIQRIQEDVWTLPKRNIAQPHRIFLFPAIQSVSNLNNLKTLQNLVIITCNLLLDFSAWLNSF